MLPSILQYHVPGFITKQVIRELSRLTADAFQCAPPDLHGLSSRACLREYAQYTNRLAQTLISQEEDIELVKERLYQNAFRLGLNLRQRFHVTSWEDVMAASRMIYRILGIVMVADSRGNITITSCSFSQYYSEAVCRIMSALDEGMAAGLSGGGKLEFQQRMTQGSDCCQAHFIMRGEQ